ncbi:MAG: DUF445 family protein, partial [Lysobacteraceae bacterium]
ACDAKTGDAILDLCAGAGGKSLGLAAVAPGARILATDSNRARLSKLPERAERAGAEIETRLLNPPRELDELADWRGHADIVLVDAPCSGSGTWRRNPEGRWRLTPERLDRVIADRIARKLVDGATTLVAEMADDPRHEMRLRLGAQLEALILRLEDDPQLRARIDHFRDQLLEQEELAAYLRSLWTDLVAWLQADVRREDSELRARIARAAQALGEGLAADADTRAWLNGWIQEACEPLIDRYRDAIRAFIVERIEQWSAEELTRELELSIGTDLQYIRYNGTAVGALIGGAIYAAGQLAHVLAG